MLDFIERLKSKPHHVRHRIAVGTSVGVTGVVAAGWLFALVFSGKLLLTPPTTGTGPDGTNPDVATAETQTSSGFNQLLGAVGVATATTAPASLTIVDAPKSTPAPKPERNSAGQVVIPF